MSKENRWLGEKMICGLNAVENSRFFEVWKTLVEGQKVMIRLKAKTPIVGAFVQAPVLIFDAETDAWVFCYDDSDGKGSREFDDFVESSFKTAETVVRRLDKIVWLASGMQIEEDETSWEDILRSHGFVTNDQNNVCHLLSGYTLVTLNPETMEIVEYFELVPDDLMLKGGVALGKAGFRIAPGFKKAP